MAPCYGQAAGGVHHASTYLEGLHSFQKPVQVMGIRQLEPDVVTYNALLRHCTAGELRNKSSKSLKTRPKFTAGSFRHKVSLAGAVRRHTMAQQESRRSRWTWVLRRSHLAKIYQLGCEHEGGAEDGCPLGQMASFCIIGYVQNLLLDASSLPV